MVGLQECGEEHLGEACEVAWEGGMEEEEGEASQDGRDRNNGGRLPEGGSVDREGVAWEGSEGGRVHRGEESEGDGEGMEAGTASCEEGEEDRGATVLVVLVVEDGA